MWSRNVQGPCFWDKCVYNAANGGPLSTASNFFTSAIAKAYFKLRLRYLIARSGYNDRTSVLPDRTGVLADRASM